jgi:hypothetical protein
MNTIRRTAACCATYCAAFGLACLPGIAGASSDPPVAGPLGGGENVLLEPAPPPANPRRHREVFVCQDGGAPVFADRPCGPVTASRNLVVESPQSGAAATTVPPSPRSSTRPRAVQPKRAAAVSAAPETACTRLQRQLEEIDDRMRTGYSAREAARLWQRWRDAKERLRTARC